MSDYRQIYNKTQDVIVLKNGKWCASFACHFKGLMFRRNLPPDDGLIFVRKSKSIINTTIHMLFCFFPIGVIWLDDELQVALNKALKEISSQLTSFVTNEMMPNSNKNKQVPFVNTSSFNNINPNLFHVL